MRAIDSLIRDAFSEHPLSAEEIQTIADHVATAGFDPDRQINASREIAGLIWHGQRIEAGKRIAVNAAHYLKHVVLQREWPAGTALAQYEADAVRAVRDPGAGVFISTWQGNRNIGVMSYAATARGPQGSGWVLVEYRVRARHWVTAFQSDERPDYPNLPERTRLQWLRQPS